MNLLYLSALLLGFAGVAGAAPGRGNLAPVDGEVIVRFKPTANVLQKHALGVRAAPKQVSEVLAGRAAALGARLGRQLETGPAVGERMQVLRARGVSAQVLATQLNADADVEFAEPNGRKRRMAAPNDPLYPATGPGGRPGGPDSGQWYLRAPTAGVVSGINIEAAWARSSGSGNIVVAVLDTGVRGDHPDLTGRLVGGYDFVSNPAVANDGDGRDADPSDPGDWVTSAEAGSSPFTNCTAENSSWHGTATASLIGATANNGIGMAGTAPGVRVQPVRVLGKCFGNDSDIQAAMRWAAGISVAGVPDNPTPAKVINLSLGGTGACSASYQTAVNEILARGVVIVAAAGNSAGHPVGTPANCNGVIAVLALRHAGTKVGFSDLGSQITIAAPGGNCINVTAGSPCLYPIVAATNAGNQAPAGSAWTDGFKASVGTSFASPLVAGTVGLMFSVQPALTPALVRSHLQATARPFPTSGADNGTDPTPVAQCTAPSEAVDQLQCYCNTTYCGAGMLDAGAAVTASVAGPYLTISQHPVAPVVGESVAFRITGVQTPAGQAANSYAWSLSNGTTAATGFTTATNADSAAVTPALGGFLGVQLAVTDAAGGTVTAQQGSVVSDPSAPPPATPPPTTPAPADTGGGGGGATSAPWLLLLMAAVLGLSGGRRRA